MLLISSLSLKLGLPPRLQVGSKCQGFHYVPGISQATCNVHQGLVANQVGQVVDGPVQLRLCAVDVFPLPGPRCHHGCAYVDEDAPR